ncbi:hypothetical protein SteCoe_28348 [Stentor coeruleus]|uniref:Uncharacterized protein n=1 Tax=Stentor coeruleus TaxID=5963 RepID=A0A1R2B8E2_9CILI|nr:hypothetical protein SteCoe_28348 [Stentor coeruleus]
MEEIQDLCIYALITGIDSCSTSHNIDRQTLFYWTSDLDFDNNQFFIQMRRYIRIMISTFGIQDTAKILEIPLHILELFHNEYHKPISRRIKKRIINYYLKGIPLISISEFCNLPLEKIQDVISAYKIIALEIQNKKKKEYCANFISNDVKEEDIIVLSDSE